MLPAIRRIAAHVGLRRYLFNTSWMLTEQILRLLVGLAVGVYVARFLGPGRYGLYSYSVAYVGIFGALAKLGIDTFVVRDLVTHPDQRDEIIGTAFWLRVAGGTVALALVAMTLPWNGNDAPTNTYVLIVAFGLVVQAFDVFDYFFQATVQGKYSSICKIAQLVASSAVRLVLIYVGADLIWFVIAVLLDQITLAAAYAFVAWRERLMTAFSHFARRTAVRLLRNSWPLILSGVAIMLYMRIDQVMIKAMLGDREVGIYAVAVRLAEIVYFVPMILVVSLYPIMVTARNTSVTAFRETTLAFLEIMTLVALATTLPLFFLADWIVLTLFGPAFAEAATVLRVNLWASFFIFSGLVAHQWAVTQNRVWQPMVKAIVGALLNIVLNLILIPRIGVVGAAIATLISQAVASIALNLAFADMRACFFLQIRALFLPGPGIIAFLRTRGVGARIVPNEAAG